MDPRSMRSRALLRDALAKTLETLPFEHVTVVLLTKRAGVNRSTFYQHYATTGDLLIDLVNVRLDETGLADVDPNTLDTSSEQPPQFVVKLMDFMVTARTVFVGQLTSSAKNTLCVQFLSHLRSIFASVIESRQPDYTPQMSFIAAPALAGGITGVIWAWLQSDDPPSQAEMEAWLWRIIRLSLLAHQEGQMSGTHFPDPLPS